MEKEETKTERLFQQLVETAIAGRHRPFEFICDLAERKAVKVCVRATKKVIGMFEGFVDESAKAYAESIKLGKQDPEALLAYSQLKQCMRFYEGELATLKDMLKEYGAYVFGGNLNWLKAIFGIRRSESDMVDYRTLPWSLF